MRDNGLPSAASYVALVDVDPPVADHVLSLLAAAGVSAYAAPVTGEVGPYQDVRPPLRPLERVHVDRSRTREARDAVGGLLPGLRADFHAAAAMAEDRADAADRVDAMRREEVDAAFADLVAGLDLDPAAPDKDVPGSGLSGRLVRRGRRDDSEPGGDGDGFDWSEYPIEADDEPLAPSPEGAEDRYQPPPPPPLPRLDPVGKAAWAGVVGGPVLLLALGVLRSEVPTWGLLLCLAMFVGGFATLVARMQDRRPQDDGWDDGAVV